MGFLFSWEKVMKDTEDKYTTGFFDKKHTLKNFTKRASKSFTNKRVAKKYMKYY